MAVLLVLYLSVIQTVLSANLKPTCNSLHVVHIVITFEITNAKILTSLPKEPFHLLKQYISVPNRLMGGWNYFNEHYEEVGVNRSIEMG